LSGLAGLGAVLVDGAGGDLLGPVLSDAAFLL
jgi:hypothetical protein